MINEEILFEEKKVYSGKLEKEVTLEVYEKGNDNKKIVTSKSLVSLFEQEKNGLGAKLDTHKEEVSFDPKTGLPVYCLCRAVISDANGSSKPEYGESMPTTRLNTISSNHPFTTAENRAASKAIRKYLQLPNYVYSSDEVPVESPDPKSAKEDVKNIIQSLGEKATKEAKEAAADPVTETTDTSSGLAEAPIERAMSESTIDEPKEDPKETPSEEKENPKPEEKEAPAEEAVPTKEDAEKETAVDSYNLDTVVTFGPGKGKTIREVLEAPECAKFVEKVQSGSVVIPTDDKEKATVIKAIMAMKK